MHGTKVKCDFNKAINMHSRGSTEQHFYIWEPHCGYPHIKEGQWSHNIGKWSRTPMFYTTNTNKLTSYITSWTANVN